MKICTKCLTEKDMSEFWGDSKRKDGLKSWCRKCLSDYDNEWRRKNIEQYRATCRFHSNKYATNNKEKLKQKRKAQFERDPEKARAYFRIKTRERRHTPRGKLSSNVSRAMRHSIKTGSKAERHWESLVGYTADQLKRHLEKRFKPGMTWENYGTVWCIDHKTPISAFNFERPEEIDFRICWSLKNLQPMIKTENQSKGNNIDGPFQPSLAIATG